MLHLLFVRVLSAVSQSSSVTVKPIRIQEVATHRSTPDRAAACFIRTSLEARGNCLRFASSMYVAS